MGPVSAHFWMIACLSAPENGHFFMKNAFLAILPHLVTSMCDPITPYDQFLQWSILTSVPVQDPIEILKVISFFFIFFLLWIWGVMNFQIWALLAHLLPPYGCPRTMFTYSCGRHISWCQLSQRFHSQLIFPLIFKKKHVTCQFCHFWSFWGFGTPFEPIWVLLGSSD